MTNPIKLKNIKYKDISFIYNNKPRTIFILDEFLPQEDHFEISRYLTEGKWEYGWQSAPGERPFWHRHFAGSRQPAIASETTAEADCETELSVASPAIHRVWQALRQDVLDRHRLLRCYANGFTYGCEGSLHKDAKGPRNLTCIYYANERWHPNFGGETVFFEKTCDDILCSVYPKPNRLAIVPGNVPHVARGVTQSCPQMRITLMFKVEEADG